MLFDTLLGQVSLEELLSILGHEIGHWKLWHSASGFLVSQLYLLCALGAFAAFAEQQALFQAFGFAGGGFAGGGFAGRPVIVARVLFSQTRWAPVDKVRLIICVCLFVCLFVVFKLIICIGFLVGYNYMYVGVDASIEL